MAAGLSIDMPLVSLVLFIAVGALVVMLLFIFGKRQIMRFRSSRKPHVDIGHDVPKLLREKIHHCLEKTKSIYFEPTLLSEEVQNAACSSENHYYYRMKALDAFSNAVTTLQWGDSSVPKRQSKQTIQLFLYCLCPSAAGSKDAVIVEKFAKLYKHARHSPVVFGEKEFIRYMELLDKIIRLIKMDQKRRSKTLKAVDLEVRVKGSKGTETIVCEDKVETIPLEPLHHRGRGGLGVVMEAHRDISSGYSSTDRSSSDRGSAERLISHELRRV